MPEKVPTYSERQFSCPECFKVMCLTLAEYFKEIYSCPYCGKSGDRKSEVKIIIPLHSAPKCIRSKTIYSRTIKMEFLCNLSPQGRFYTPKGDSEGFHITLNQHSHYVQYNAIIDFCGTSGELLLDCNAKDFTGPNSSTIQLLLKLGRKDIENAVAERPVLAEHFANLRIQISDLQYESIYDSHDQYSINSGFVDECVLNKDAICRRISKGVFYLIHDLAGELALGYAPKRKTIAFQM